MARLLVLCLVVALTACSAPSSRDAGPIDVGGVEPDASVPDAGTWRLVLSELPATLLSAWESSDGVLYAVGGTSTSALVLRHDAQGWWTMDPGTASTLWWVHGFAADDVFAVGANGVVTHFDGTRWTVLREGGEATLFGAWGASHDDFLAVGGVVNDLPRASLVRLVDDWAEFPIFDLPGARSLFKVWGTSADDLIVVGERGLIARGTPGNFVVQPTPTTERITTVHGAGSTIYAVGGLLEPVALRFTAGEWRSFSVPGSPQLLNGVAVSASGEAVLVGLDGYVAEGRGQSFVAQRVLTRWGLHGVAVTREGFVAVGGDLLGSLGHGVVLVRGGTLGATALQPWPSSGVPFDGGVVDDGGVDGGTDAGPPQPPDGGWLGPGASCDEQPADCDPTRNLSCWFVFGPYRSYCGGSCTDVAECGAYGAGACCKLPGPQVTQPVCLPEIACDGGT